MVTKFRRVLFLALLLLMTSGLETAAQQLGREAIKKIVHEAADQLEQRYIFPDTGKNYAKALKAKFRNGDFEEYEDPDAFAEKLTAVLQDVHADAHLRVQSPSMARRRYRPAGNISREEMMERRIDMERRNNFYFSKVAVFDGNIGYFKMDKFAIPVDGAKTRVDAVMRFLQDTEAVIMDLRHNAGGAEGLNRYISSYFFEAGTDTVLYTRYIRQADSTGVVRTIQELPGPRMAGKDLYILVGPLTGSSAENISYSLQSIGKATVVGSATAGAAHSSRVYPLGYDFSIQVPIARVSNPYTNASWEGTGVQPDIKVEPDEALLVCRKKILEKKAGTVKNRALREELNRSISEIERQIAEKNRPSLSIEEAEIYTGSYEKNRRVYYEHGTLYLQRTGGPKIRLKPDDPDNHRFHLDLPPMKNPPLRFLADSAGNITGLEIKLRGRTSRSAKLD